MSRGPHFPVYLFMIKLFDTFPCMTLSIEREDTHLDSQAKPAKRVTFCHKMTRNRIFVGGLGGSPISGSEMSTFGAHTLTIDPGYGRGIYFTESVNFFPTYFATQLNFFPISCTHCYCSLLNFFPNFNFG